MAVMKAAAIAAGALLSGAVGGCVAHSHQESAALRAPWPRAPSRALGAYEAPVKGYPTVGGDILKGTSPAEQAAARAAAVRPMDEPTGH
jgi:hypothetical protein